MNHKTPTELFIRESRKATPTEFAWHRIAGLGDDKIRTSIDYGYEQKNNKEWWYWRLQIIESENSLQWFGPYPTEQICIERIEYARKHDNLSQGGGISQNINAPTERAMINDIFGKAGLGVPQMVPRR